MIRGGGTGRNYNFLLNDKRRRNGSLSTMKVISPSQIRFFTICLVQIIVVANEYISTTYELTHV